MNAKMLQHLRLSTSTKLDVNEIKVHEGYLRRNGGREGLMFFFIKLNFFFAARPERAE
jgi:hypothetical protein